MGRPQRSGDARLFLGGSERCLSLAFLTVFVQQLSFLVRESVLTIACLLPLHPLCGGPLACAENKRKLEMVLRAFA